MAKKVSKKKDVVVKEQPKVRVTDQTEIQGVKETQKEPQIFFISGSKYMTDKLFMQYYMNLVIAGIQDIDNTYFVIGDEGFVTDKNELLGVDAFLQTVFYENLPEDKQNHVTILYSGEKPILYVNVKKDEKGNVTKPVNFQLINRNFETPEERDAAMTILSNRDFHVLCGYSDEERVKNNIARRSYPVGKYDYQKYLKGTFPEFWQNVLNGVEYQPVDEPVHD